MNLELLIFELSCDQFEPIRAPVSTVGYQATQFNSVDFKTEERYRKENISTAFAIPWLKNHNNSHLSSPIATAQFGSAPK